jgi:hypothetical protein
VLQLRDSIQVLCQEVNVDEVRLLDCHFAHKLVQFGVELAHFTVMRFDVVLDAPLSFNHCIKDVDNSPLINKLKVVHNVDSKDFDQLVGSVDLISLVDGGIVKQQTRFILNSDLTCELV